MNFFLEYLFNFALFFCPAFLFCLFLPFLCLFSFLYQSLLFYFFCSKHRQLFLAYPAQSGFSFRFFHDFFYAAKRLILRRRCRTESIRAPLFCVYKGEGAFKIHT